MAERYVACFSGAVFDPDVPVVVPRTAESDVRRRTRRVQRTATLDGGAVLSDAGYSHADRTLRVALDGDGAVFDRLARLLEAQPTVVVGVDDGVYLGALAELAQESGRIRAEILVTRKLSED